MSQRTDWTVMLQCCPRFDSITAFYLLAREGQKKYPGIQNAQVRFWNTGTISPDGLTWQQYLNQGVILVGVGGGLYDEHPSEEFGDRKAENLSATMLVARDLGVDRSPLYRGLIETITKNDLNQVSDMTVLSNVVKLMHRNRNNRMGPDEIIRWAFLGLDAIVDSKRRFELALADFPNLVRSEIVHDANGRPFKIATVCSDNDQMSAASRYRKQDGIAVLIQRRHSGLTQIFGTMGLGVKLHRVAATIRRAELNARAINQVVIPSQELLEQPGQLAVMPDWCYIMPGEIVANGTETACGLKPTALSLWQIHRLVCDNIVFEGEAV